MRELGQPRSLLNPLGVSEETISRKNSEISDCQMTLAQIRHQFNQVTTNLNSWQQEMKNYQTWLNEPQTQKMQKLEEYLSTPAIMEQRQRIRQGYALYKALEVIITLHGEPRTDPQYIEGKTYRIEKQGNTLTMTHKERGTVAYQATDNRQQEGIIEMGQLQLSQQEIEQIQAYAQFLEEEKHREQHSTNNRGFSR